MRTKNRRAEMGIWSLIVVLLISSTASLRKKCPSNILKKFLSDPSNAKEHYDNGEAINVTCLADSGDDGYEYSNYDGSEGLDTKNIRVLKCTDGKWIGHYPGCFSNCSKPDIYAILNPEYDVYAPGDNVTVTACKKDNAGIEGDTTLICMADGTWIGSARCPKQHMSCNEQPQTISNAYITDVVRDEYKHGTVLQYKCSQAFDQMGKYSVRCHDGRWIPDSASRIRCIIGHCSHIYSRDIGNMRVKNISGQVGTYAEFECYDGYELDGSAKILCMADRKWYPEIPKCKPISCPPPKQILHGSLIQEAYNGLLNIYQSTIRYDCDQGYRIVGPRFRKCQSDRTWSGNDTKCEEIVCEKPSNPENGKVYLTDNSQKVGSQIEYICDEHHIMEPITSQFAICTVHGHWSSPQPLCIKICKVRALSHGSIRTISGFERKKTEDSYVHDNTELYFTCNDGYERYASGYETRGRLKCVNITLLPGPPECRPKRCFIEPPIDLEYFVGQEQVLNKYIYSGFRMHARCSNRTELFRSSSYLDREQVPVNCNFGKLEPESLVCQDKRCKIITTIENGHFTNRGKEIVTGEKIYSGSDIKLICSEGYELYNKTNSMYLELEQTDIKCYQGSFTPEIPSCKPRPCLIEPSVFLEYFIEGNKVLQKYVDNGTLMQARCPDRMELVLSSSYLDSEHYFVQCTLGTLEPRTLDCKDKRCNITQIENGKLVNGENVIDPRAMIGSNSNITLVCSEGYELYNESISMYLESEKTDILCYQGSFNVAFPNCRPKRCQVGKSLFLLPEVHYVEHGHNLTVHCPDKMEFHPERNGQNLEELLMFCSNGKWTPTLPMCIKKIICDSFYDYNLENGHIFYSSRYAYTVGTVVSFLCNSGYVRDGPETRTCQIDGTWSGECVTCQRITRNPSITCPAPCVPEGARKTGSHTYEIGSRVEFNCPRSKTQDRDDIISIMYCIKDGEYASWNGTMSNCKEMCKISDLSREITDFIVSETKTTPGEFVPHNQSIKAVCGDGNRSQGVLTCNAGIWTGNSTCELGCVLKDPGMHFISLGNRTVLNVGENANVSCKFGYQIVSNKSTTHADQYDYGASASTANPYEMSETEDNENLIAVSDGSYTCRDSGKWEPEIRFSCKQMCKTIDLAREITGFIVSETKTKPGEFISHNQSIEIVCGEGYRPHGSLTCNAGIWMGNATCEPDVTGCVLKDPGMHFISLGNRKVLKVGENANVSCEFGYQIVPNLSAKRAYEYYYGDSESTADPYEMPETEDNENFIAVSDGNYTCRDNGKWEPELRFSCKQIVCDSFDRFNLENGNIIYSTHYVYTVGTVASFQCNPGYFRHGSETRTCQVDGTWSGECVTCQRITLNISMTCPAPCVPEGARKTGSHTYEIGSIVKFNCPRSKTQDRDDRSNIRHCIKNGEYASWNGTKINCKEIICDKGDHYGFENGRVTYSSSVATVGTEASFMCNSGYNRHGPKTRICQKDGTWSGGCVKCQKHQHNSSTCPAPCVPDGAKKTGSLSYEIGSRIQFYCFQANMNFNVENSYIRHCVNDGKSASWNGTEINCKVKCKPLTDTYNVVQTGVVPGILSDKTVVELICNGSLVPVRAECRKGRWHPKKPTCKYTCPLSAVKGTLYNYKVRKDQVFPGPIESGSQIKVTCEDGFFPNTHNYDVSKCVNGVWTPEIVKCEKTDNF